MIHSLMLLAVILLSRIQLSLQGNDCPSMWIGSGNARTFIFRCNRGFNGFYPSSTKCLFKCRDSYYKHGGDETLNCLSTGNWSGNILDCRKIKCPLVPKVSNEIKVVTPAVDCFKTNMEVGHTCPLYCPYGYELVGSHVFRCLKGVGAIGELNPKIKDSPPRCVDRQPPKFANSVCSSGIDIKSTTVVGKNFAIIKFPYVNVTDNSNKDIQMSCLLNHKQYCNYEMGKMYPIGIGRFSIRMKATDSSGNSNFCRILVTVEDKEKPTLLTCPDNVVVDTSTGSASVFWREPTYADNCGNYPLCGIRTMSNIGKRSGSRFAVGTVTVNYRATDPSGNFNDECIFLIRVKVKTCAPLSPPINGAFISTKGIIKAYCRRGTYPDKAFSIFYYCQSGKWYSPTRAVFTTLPDCIRTTPPPGSIPGFTLDEFTGDCSSMAVQTQMKALFMVFGLCPSCNNNKQLTVTCGKNTAVH